MPSLAVRPRRAAQRPPSSRQVLTAVGPQPPNEGNPTAKSFCVLKAALAVLVAGSDLPRVKGRRSHGAALEATGDGQVECGRAYTSAGRRPDGWQEPVSQAPSSPGRGGSSPSFSTSGLKPAEAARLHSVPPTRTGAGVVPEAVGSPVAQWAEAIGACNREPGPHAEQNAKEGGLQVQPQCLGRAGGQPRTSTRLLQKLQVGPLCCAGSGDRQLGQLGSVQRGREVLLSGRANRRSSDAVGSQHGSVEPLHRSGCSGPVSRIAGIQLLAPGSRTQTEAR